jgi:hypothetical protein
MPHLLATRRLTTHPSLSSAQGTLCIMRKLHFEVGATGTRLGYFLSPVRDGSKLRRGASFKRRLESTNEENQSQPSQRYNTELVLRKIESEIVSVDAPPGYDCLVRDGRQTSPRRCRQAFGP